MNATVFVWIYEI